MTKSRVIRVFSFIMALTLVFAMCSPGSYAISPRQFGAWVASALTALNITYQSTFIPAASFLDYIADPFQITNNIVEHVTLTNPRDNIEQYLKQSTISFTGDYIEIDGKHYQDVWLSNNAAEKFRVNAFDIKSAFDIASNSNGTYVSGAGNFDGIPIFSTDNGLVSQQYYISSLGTFKTGPFTYSAIPSTSNTDMYLISVVNGTETRHGNQFFPNIQEYKVSQAGGNTISRRMKTKWSSSSSGSWSDWRSFSIPNVEYDSTPFDFDWVSGLVPADQVLSPDEGLHIYVPANPSEWSDNPDVQTIINNYNTYLQNNPDISPDVDLDLNTEGLLDKIGDLLDILGPIINLMKPSFGPQGQQPTPPIPGDTIANTPWADLVNWLQRILNKLDDILSIRDILSNFKTAFDTAISTIENIFSSIKSVLDSILDAIQNIADSIVNGNADWFSDIVDAIKKPFLPWLNIFKTGVNIWHYVVEWLQSIHEPFVFFFGILNSLGTTFVLPFYAVAAACIVIAIYRRFGR